MAIPFEVPGRFTDPLLYARIGALIKDKGSGKIVAHVQETGAWNLLKGVPIPGGNPLGLLTDSVQIGQLMQIQQTLNTVQTLSTIAAVSSVASLGVSVAGFGLVLARLARMDAKLDSILDQSTHVRQLLHRMHLKLDTLQMARLRAELEAIGLAARFDRQRRRDSLQRSIDRLAELRHYYGALLSDPELLSVGTQGVTAIMDAHERLTAAAEAELFAEFLLDGEAPLLQARWCLQKAVFNQVAWQDAVDLYARLEEADRQLRVDLVTPPEDRKAKVRALMETRRESMARLESLPLLAEVLGRQGISATDYVAAIEAQRRDGTSPLLLLPV